MNIGIKMVIKRWIIIIKSMLKVFNSAAQNKSKKLRLGWNKIETRLSPKSFQNINTKEIQKIFNSKQASRYFILWSLFYHIASNYIT